MSSNTSLARQLQKLKLPQTSQHREKHGTVSFLYDFIQAKTIEIDTHYAYAIDSLENLIQNDPKLKKFKDNLFHHSSKHFDRATKTKEVNEQMDTLIEEFLFRISKYFQLTDTHKVLEYLIQKYRIHEYNVDALFVSVLPFHETRTFVRLLQTITAVKNPSNARYHWLKSVQENGVPLTKLVLFNHCISDPDFTRFITDTIFRVMELDPDNHIFPSFLTSFCLNILQRCSNNDSMIAFILSVLSKSLSMKNPQLYSSSKMIFCHLCTLKILEKKIINKLLKSFLRRRTSLDETLLITFEIVLKSQKVDALPVNFIEPEFVEMLIRDSSQYRLENLTRAVILTLLEQTDDNTVEEHKEFLRQLLEVSQSITEMTIKRIISWVNENDDEKYYKICTDVMNWMEKLYPKWFDVAVTSLNELKNVSRFLKSIRYAVVDGHNFILDAGLKHSDPQVRLQSLTFFAKNFGKLIGQEREDLMYVRQSLMDGLTKEPLQAEHLDFLLEIFGVKEKIFDVFDVEQFEKLALHILKQCEQLGSDTVAETEVAGKSFRLKKMLIEVYCSKSYMEYCGADSSFLKRLFHDEMQQLLLVESIAADYEQFKLSQIIFNSTYTETNSLFQAIKVDLPSFSKKSLRNLTVEDQAEQIQTFSRHIIYSIGRYLHASAAKHFVQPNLFQSIGFPTENVRFLFLFLYVLLSALDSNVPLGTEQRHFAWQFAIDILARLLEQCRIRSRAELKILNPQDYKLLDMDRHFLIDFAIFNGFSISALIGGYIGYRFLEMARKFSKDELPNADRLDWFLTHVPQTSPFYDFLLKLYNFLDYYSTPSPDKPKISKKIYKVFRMLRTHFLRWTVSVSGLKFFLPSIVASQDPSLQRQMLNVLEDLLQQEECGSWLLESLNDDRHHLLAYLLALISSGNEIEVRRLALSNLKVIGSRMDKHENAVLVRTIVDKENEILLDENVLSQILGNLDQNELIESMVIILIDRNSKILSGHKVSLLKLLRCSPMETRSKVFKFYLETINFDSLNEDDKAEQLKVLLELYYEDPDLLKQDIDQTCWKFLLRCIETTASLPSSVSKIIMEKLLTPERFQKIMDANRELALKIVYTLLRAALELAETIAADPDLVDCIQKTLRSITFDSVFIVEMMNLLLPIDDIYDKLTVSNEKPSHDEPKRLKIHRSYGNPQYTKWKLFRIYVSLFANSDHLDSLRPELIKALFEYLKLTFMDVDDNSSESTRQTLLLAIYNCVETKLSKSRSPSTAMKQMKPIKRSLKSRSEPMQVDCSDDDPSATAEFINNINVDRIIDCMLESRVKETQRIALLLVDLVAPYFAKQITEYLVAIFTFIGSNLLECDDQYSLTILFETMESIIPIIICEETSDGSDPKQYMTSVFIKSFSDIPAYRRLPLFTKLIELFGAERYLPLITVRLFEQIICAKKSESEKEANLLFLNSLFGHFPYDLQLRSICVLLSLFQKKFLDNHFRQILLKKFGKNQSKSAVLVPSNNPTQFELIVRLVRVVAKDFQPTLNGNDLDKYACGLEILNFVRTLMASPEFGAGVRSLPYDEISAPMIYLLNLILELIVALGYGSGSLKSNFTVYRKRMKSAVDAILLRYQALLPNDKIFEIILHELLDNTAQTEPAISLMIKRKALELLNEKLTNLKPEQMSKETCTKIIQELTRQLETSIKQIDKLDDAQLYIIQLILVSLKIMTKFINLEQPEGETELFSDVLVLIIRMIRSLKPATVQLKSIQNLKISSILCLAQIMACLSLDGINHLSDVVALILDNFDSKIDIAIISNVSALYKIVTKFARFLSPHLKSIILRVLPVFDADIPELRPKLNYLWNSIAESVPKRIVFETIDASYQEVISGSSSTSHSLVELMRLFQLSCNHVERSDVEIILKNLKNLMVKSLNYRAVSYQQSTTVDSLLVERIETSCCEAFAAFIPKLTESHFRPLFYSLLQWAIHVDERRIPEPDGKPGYRLPNECYYRMISFYRFCSFLAERLKSLFCVFVAPAIVQHCGQILVAYHSPETDHHGEEVSAPDESGLRIDNAEIGEPLVASILATMAKCFLYDLNATFVNKDCFASVVKPIVNQITNTYGTAESYERRLELILQCTQYLIQNNHDETLIKDFNYQILLKTRESNEMVKASAIRVLHRLILTCNEDYLPFVPEIMSFIAELSEEDSPTVEAQLRPLIVDLEQLIGEPIKKYL